MPVTELATFSLQAGSNVTDPNTNAGKTWRTICQTVSQADKFEGLFYGHEVESPDVVQLFVNWDKLESHKKFMESPEYGPMVDRLKTIMVGSPHFIHYDFVSKTGALTSALSAPVTELATFYLASKTSSFQSRLDEFEKAISEEKPQGFTGIVTAWSVEDDVQHQGFGEGGKGKAVLLAIGWQSVDAHMAYRETDHFKKSIKALYEDDEPRGVELHHVKIQSSS